MRTISVREAKSHLSQVLHDVQYGGAQWTITHRGQPVARIVPVEQVPLMLEQRIRMLEEQGVLEPIDQAVQAELAPPLPVGGGIAQRLLQEDRDAGR